MLACRLNNIHLLFDTYGRREVVGKTKRVAGMRHIEFSPFCRRHSRQFQMALLNFTQVFFNTHSVLFYICFFCIVWHVKQDDVARSTKHYKTHNSSRRYQFNIKGIWTQLDSNIDRRRTHRKERKKNKKLLREWNEVETFFRFSQNWAKRWYQEREKGCAEHSERLSNIRCKNGIRNCTFLLLSDADRVNTNYNAIIKWKGHIL